MNAATAGSTSVRPSGGSRTCPLTMLLLSCGIASSALYVAMNIVSAIQYPGYDSASQAVSEFSAIEAPTRPLWVAMGTIYTLLVAAFGGGVWMARPTNGPVRLTGALLIAYGLIGPFWPPMHMRGEVQTLTDTLHIAFTMATVLLMMLAMAFGAAAFGRRFRVYSMLTIGHLILFGTLSGMEAPGVTTNQPTPLLGVWERINIGVFLLWVVVLAIALMRQPRRFEN